MLRIFHFLGNRSKLLKGRRRDVDLVVHWNFIVAVGAYIGRVNLSSFGLISSKEFNTRRCRGFRRGHLGKRNTGGLWVSFTRNYRSRKMLA